MSDPELVQLACEDCVVAACLLFIRIDDQSSVEAFAAIVRRDAGTLKKVLRRSTAESVSQVDRTKAVRIADQLGMLNESSIVDSVLGSKAIAVREDIRSAIEVATQLAYSQNGTLGPIDALVRQLYDVFASLKVQTDCADVVVWPEDMDSLVSRFETLSLVVVVQRKLFGSKYQFGPLQSLINLIDYIVDQLRWCQGEEPSRLMDVNALDGDEPWQQQTHPSISQLEVTLRTSPIPTFVLLNLLALVSDALRAKSIDLALTVGIDIQLFLDKARNALDERYNLVETSMRRYCQEKGEVPSTLTKRKKLLEPWQEKAARLANYCPQVKALFRKEREDLAALQREMKVVLDERQRLRSCVAVKDLTNVPVQKTRIHSLDEIEGRSFVFYRGQREPECYIETSILDKTKCGTVGLEKLRLRVDGLLPMGFAENSTAVLAIRSANDAKVDRDGNVYVDVATDGAKDLTRDLGSELAFERLRQDVYVWGDDMQDLHVIDPRLLREMKEQDPSWKFNINPPTLWICPREMTTVIPEELIELQKEDNVRIVAIVTKFFRLHAFELKEGYVETRSPECRSSVRASVRASTKAPDISSFFVSNVYTAEGAVAGVIKSDRKPNADDGKRLILTNIKFTSPLPTSNGDVFCQYVERPMKDSPGKVQLTVKKMPILGTVEKGGVWRRK